MTENHEELEVKVRQMMQIGNSLSPAWSPDGRQLAFIWNVSGLPQLWTIAREGDWPTQLTALPDPLIDLGWSPAGNWIALEIAPAGGMNQQIYLIRPDGSGLRLVSDGGKENNLLDPPVWSHDGRLMFNSNRRDPAYLDSYLGMVEPDGKVTVKAVVPNRGMGHLCQLSQNGRKAILYRLENRSDSNLFLLNLDEQGGLESDPVLLTPHSGPGNFNYGCFEGASDNVIYLLTDFERDKTALGRIQLGSDGNPGPIELVSAREDAVLNQFELSQDGKLAALLWNVAGRHELAWLDIASGQTRPGPKLPAEVVSKFCFSPDGAQLAVCASNATTPSNIWILDVAEGQTFRQLTNTQHPGIKLDELVAPELVNFEAHDGLALSGWLYRPKGFVGPGPVVLWFHGGPEGQEQPLLNTFYQAVLSRGIAVFAPNVRGSGGFGKRFVNLDNGALRFDAIKDIKACIDYVVSAGVGQPGRLGIAGGSYGGYMTMAGLVEYPDLLAAGANLYGVVNFETFFAHTEPWMAAISKIEYGDPDTELDLLRRLSPLQRIEQVKSPTLVLHGATDTKIPVS